MSARMNEEVGRKWVEELRSGKWEQGVGWLGVADTNKRCCLGVLMECAQEAGVSTRRVEYAARDGMVIAFDTSGAGAWEVRNLTSEVADWAALDSLWPTVEVDGVEIPLTEVNDTVGLSFGQIADLIEAQFLDAAS